MLHVHRQGLNHTVVNAVQFFYLTRHLAGLFIDLVYRAHLRTDTLQLHLVYRIDARQRTVQIIHLLGITRHVFSLFGHTRQGFGQCLQLFHIIFSRLLHFGSRSVTGIFKHFRKKFCVGSIHHIGQSLYIQRLLPHAALHALCSAACCARHVRIYSSRRPGKRGASISSDYDRPSHDYGLGYHSTGHNRLGHSTLRSLRKVPGFLFADSLFVPILFIRSQTHPVFIALQFCRTVETGDEKHQNLRPHTDEQHRIGPGNMSQFEQSSKNNHGRSPTVRIIQECLSGHRLNPILNTDNYVFSILSHIFTSLIFLFTFIGCPRHRTYTTETDVRTRLVLIFV